MGLVIVAPALWAGLVGLRGIGSASAWLCAAVLAAPACIAAALAAGPDRPDPPVRLGMCFVLAAAWLVEPPAAFAVAALAALAGRGAGLIGPAGGEPLPRLAGALLVLAPLSIAAPWGARVAPDAAAQLVVAVGLLGALQIGSYVAARLLSPYRPAAPPRTWLHELIAAPLAVLLVDLWTAGAGWTLGGVVTATLGAALLLRRLERARADLRRTETVLSRRVTELATLHAIAREIVASRDRSRLFRTLERECAKIVDSTGFMIALAETDGKRLRVVYRRERGRPSREEPLQLTRGLAHSVLTEKRPVCLDDLPRSAERLRHDPWVLDDARSMVAMPLLVEDRVIGVLAVESRRPHAYDRAHVEVLTTVAQQAAVAIDSVRHYEMATVDSLTGLYLRDWFFRRVREEYERSRRYGGDFAVLMLDIDGFKELNDRHGHLAGDRYLEAFGGLIHDRLRSADVGCRFGGDEFCLLLPETDMEGGRTIAERLRESVASLSVEVDGKRLRATVSIGLAGFRDHDPGSVRGLLRNADQALYRAKRGGRDRVVPYAA